MKFSSVDVKISQGNHLQSPFPSPSLICANWIQHAFDVLPNLAQPDVIPALGSEATEGSIAGRCTEMGL